MAERAARRIVVVSPVLPYASIPHAGGVYLHLLHRCLTDCGAGVTFIVPTDPNAVEAIGQPEAPLDVILLGRAHKRTIPRRMLMRLAYEIDGVYRRWDPSRPPLAFAVQLLTTRASREALRRADVVDVHWPEYARLIALIRRVNPRAWVVATLHDVLSQRWERATGTPSLARRARASARQLEQDTLRRADSVVVFSDKDRDLLAQPAPRAASVEVVMPPLAARDFGSRRRRAQSPTVVFVSLLARTENDDAAKWLVADIWPSVARCVPGARLRLVGKGASERLVAACAKRSDVELLGFVDDLAEVFRDATACVVPLRRGAGVKFKTIEALLAGVPTITTPVGAEGIGESELFATVSDDPTVLVEGLVRVLTHPDEFSLRAHGAQGWAREQYGEEQFRRHVLRIYGVAGPPAD